MNGTTSRGDHALPQVAVTAAEHFPPFGLSLRAPAGLELRYLDDALLGEVARLAAEGIHDPSWMPLSGWSDAEPEARALSVQQFAWRARSALSREKWWLQFAVLRDGVVVGLQDVGAEQFAVAREVRTGSWLGLAHQGRGTGSAMRLAVLSFAFDHLRALSATTEAWKDNAPSNRVSAKAGYLSDGEHVGVTRGARREGNRYRLGVERWRTLGHPRVDVDGLTDRCRHLLGAD